MKRSSILKIINILVIITTIIAIGTVFAVAMTVAQSAPHISLGPISSNITGNIAYLDVKVTIVNRGYLTFDGIDANLSFKDSNGTTLMEGYGGPLAIIPGSTKTLVITVTIDATRIPPELFNNLMTKSQNLTVDATIRGSILPLVRLTALASGNFYWGAPIEDLTLGTTQVTIYNASYSRITLPFSLKDNSAFLPVQGTLISIILLTNGTEVGAGDTYTLNLSPGGTLSDSLYMYIKNEALGQSSYMLRLTFETNYGSIVKEVSLSA